MSDFCEKSFDVVAGLGRRFEEVHSVTLRKLVADVARNLAVVAICFVACKVEGILKNVKTYTELYFRRQYQNHLNF